MYKGNIMHFVEQLSTYMNTTYGLKVTMHDPKKIGFPTGSGEYRLHIGKNPRNIWLEDLYPFDDTENLEEVLIEIVNKHLKKTGYV